MTTFAWVGTRALAVSDLEFRLQAVYSGALGPRLPAPDSPAGRSVRRWVAHQLATEALVVRESESLGLSRQAGAAADVRKVTTCLFSYVTRDVDVSDDDVRRYYDANLDRWREPERRVIKQAVVDAPVRANRFGPRETIERGAITGEFADAVFSASPGAVVGPLKTALGWHTVEIFGSYPATTKPYAAVRDEIRADLLAAARGVAFDDWLATRRAALVQMAPGYEHPGDPALPDFVHRH